MEQIADPNRASILNTLIEEARLNGAGKDASDYALQALAQGAAISDEHVEPITIIGMRSDGTIDDE